MHHNFLHHPVCLQLDIIYNALVVSLSFVQLHRGPSHNQRPLLDLFSRAGVLIRQVVHTDVGEPVLVTKFFDRVRCGGFAGAAQPLYGLVVLITKLMDRDPDRGPIAVVRVAVGPHFSCAAHFFYLHFCVFNLFFEGVSLPC